MRIAPKKYFPVLYIQMNSEYVDSQSTAIENIIPSLAVPETIAMAEQAVQQQAGEQLNGEVEPHKARALLGASQTELRDAIIVVCLFWMLSSPFIYKQMNQFITVTEVCTDLGPPNGIGLFIHGLLCGLLYFLSQKYLVF